MQQHARHAVRTSETAAFAEELGLDDAAELPETLDEEEAPDEALTEIANCPSISRHAPLNNGLWAEFIGSARVGWQSVVDVRGSDGSVAESHA